MDPYFDLSKTIDSPVAVGPFNSPIAASGLYEMPVYKPRGIYKMKVFEVDSTTHYYLKTHKFQ